MISTWNTIGIALASYVLGILTGYFGCGFVKKELNLNPENYRNLVLVLVTIAWFISVLFELVNPSFHTSPFVHGLMGGIVGFFFKVKVK